MTTRSGLDRKKKRVARVFATLVVLGLSTMGIMATAQASYAAGTTTITVDSLGSQADANPADGVCATAAPVFCTLQAALQTANADTTGNAISIVFAPTLNDPALPPAEQVSLDPSYVPATPNANATGGYIVTDTSNANVMDTTVTRTTNGDVGAYFAITRDDVTIDFDNRVGIVPGQGWDDVGYGGILINGTNDTVENFTNIVAGESSFIAGPNSAGTTLTNGTCSDPYTIFSEECLSLMDGASNVTLDNVTSDSMLWDAVYVNAAATIDGLTIENSTLSGLTEPKTELNAYEGGGLTGGGNSAINNLTIENTTISNTQSGSYGLDLRPITLTNALITDNTFSNVGIDAPAAGFTSVYLQTTGTNDVISNNTFTDDLSLNSGLSWNKWAIYGIFAVPTADAPSGFSIIGNSIDGYGDPGSGAPINLHGNAQTPVEKNTFGVHTEPTDPTDPANPASAASSEVLDGFFLANWDTSNNKIMTWVPTDAVQSGSNVTMVVTPQAVANGPLPAVPVAVDVYWTAGNNAEVYVGRVTGITEAGSISLPDTHTTGSYRIQTIDAGGNTSQYSRLAETTTALISADQSTVAATPTSVLADGVTTSTITVTTKDATGAAVTTGGHDVVITSSLGTVSAVTDNGDGTYTATITSTTPGTANIGFSVDGTASINTTSITFTAAPALVSADQSTVAATPTSVLADGMTTSTITVTTKDATGTPLTTGGHDVLITPSMGTASAVTDNGDGTYTATITSTTPGTANIGFSVDGTASINTTSVTFTAAPALISADQSTVAATPTSVLADGVTTSTITVTTKDATGAAVTTGGHDVVITSSLGTVSAVTDNGDGTYTATITSTTPGTANIGFSVDGTASINATSITFTAVPAAVTTIPAGVLAFTGSDLLLPSGIALMLLLVGGGLFIVRRWRRQRA
jgi:adhesin/invasin